MRCRFCWLLSFVLASAAAASDQHPVDPTLQFEVLIPGLTNVTGLAFIGPDDLLLLQKDDGKVLRVTNGVLQPAPVLDVNVHAFNEQGLLGIAIDPEFIHNRQVYLFYTESSTGADTLDDNRTTIPLGNRLYRYTWDGANLVEPRLILDLRTGLGPHNGGVLAFGPDDKLYLIFGDLNQFEQLQNNENGAPPGDTGVIFRINVDGSAPSDNPFYDRDHPSNPLNRYYAYGIRNSFGIGFDPLTGQLWESENGPANYDEVNRVEPGMNGGHQDIWGPEARDPQGVADLWMTPGASYSDPEFSWALTTAPTSVTFIDSPKLGCGYRGDLLVGGYGCQVIYRFELNGTRESLAFEDPALGDLVADNTRSRCDAEQEEILFAVGILYQSDHTTDIDNGPDGLLYTVSYGTATELRRLIPVPGAVPDADLDQVNDACDCDAADDTAYAVPREVPRLRISGARTTRLSWNSQSGSAGGGTTYAVVSGALSSLHGSGDFSSACALETALAPAGTLDLRPLAPGDGWYYLVRAQNGCGSGGFGAGTPPDRRGALDLALPAACNP